MRSGCVRWFSLRKGYGFIIPDDGRDDVFVHISELEKAGIAFLIPGKEIGYEECFDRGRIICFLVFVLLHDFRFGTFTLNRVKNALSQAQAFGCDFKKFVFLNISQSLFQCQLARRDEVNGLVFSGSADVGQLFGFGRINFKVIRLGVFADNHANVNGDAGVNEHRAAILKFP